MKKIIVVIAMLISTSFLMKPSLAPTERRVVATSEVRAKAKSILEESRKKQDIRRQEEERKLAEERKQQELQKKLNELKAQEEKDAADKAKKEQEAARIKREKADPRKLVSGALDDLFAAIKKYNSQDAKSGDALFKKAGAGLNDALGFFTYEEIRKIVTTMGLSPENQFKVLQHLVGTYIDHENVIETSHLKAFGDFIRALFDTIHGDDLKKFLTTNANIKTVEQTQELLLPLTENLSGRSFEELTQREQDIVLLSSKIKSMMIDFSAKLIEILRTTPKADQEVLARMLINWVRNIPVRTSEDRQQLAHALEGLSVDWLPMDPGALHDLLFDLKASGDLKLLTNLRKKYLYVVYKSGVAQDLRAALQMLKDELPFSELFKLQKAYLEAVANPATVQEISDSDINLIISTFRALLPVFDEQQWSDARTLLTKVLNGVDSAIAVMEEQRNKAVGTKKFADLGEQLKKLLAFKKQLAGMVLPEGVWKSIVDYVKGSKSSQKFEPDIQEWNEKQRVRFLYNITERNYQTNKFVSEEEYVKALKRLVMVAHFYEYYPDILTIVSSDFQKFFNIDKAFEDGSMVKLGKYLDILGLDKNVLKFFVVNYNFDPSSILAWDRTNKKDLFNHVLWVHAIQKAMTNNDYRYIQGLDGVSEFSDAVNPSFNYLSLMSGIRIGYVDSKSLDNTYRIIDAFTDQQFKKFIASMEKGSEGWNADKYEFFFDSVIHHANPQRAKIFKDTLEAIKRRAPAPRAS